MSDVGDSGFVILRPDKDGLYQSIFRSNMGQFALNTPCSLSFKQFNADETKYITKMHSDSKSSGIKRYGFFFGFSKVFLSEVEQNKIRQVVSNPVDQATKKLRNVQLVNVLPDSERPPLNAPKLEPNDIIVGGSDGLFDNLHVAELEAAATLVAHRIKEDHISPQKLQPALSNWLMKAVKHQIDPPPGFTPETLRMKTLQAYKEHFEKFHKSATFDEKSLATDSIPQRARTIKICKV